MNAFHSVKHTMAVISKFCKHFIKMYFKNKLCALAGVAQWIECGLQTKGLPVRFPVRAHAWVAGHVPSGGNHTMMFLSSFSLPSPPSENK